MPLTDEKVPLAFAEMQVPVSEAVPSAVQRKASVAEKEGFAYGTTSILTVAVAVLPRESVTFTV